MTNNSSFRLFLRVHSFTEELDIATARQILKLGENGPKISEYSDENDGHASFDFDNTPFREGEKLSYPAFMRAVLWLQGRQIEQFRAISRSGWKADIALAGYMGMVPQDLLEEILRLNLSLWVFPIMVK